MNLYLQIFTSFAKIGAFTIGGGYAMIPLIQEEVVNKKRWIEEEDFMDVLAISQSAPGLLSVNISIFLGYRLRGTKGSVVATLGSVLPSFLIILMIAMFFAGYQDNPTVMKIFKGIRPVVVALIAVPMINMAKKAKLNIYTAALAVATALLVTFFKISPIYILLVAGCVFVLPMYIKQYREQMHKDCSDNKYDKEDGGMKS
ncbi:MAG: chromate transporter [Bacteroidales bacterium]|nr:chromate transporter [Bacteroidales bacterium]MBR4095556.1 chromate transporter [Bacteroidales bacterium]